MFAFLSELAVYDNAFAPSPLRLPLSKTSSPYTVRVRASSQNAYNNTPAIATAYGMTVSTTTE